MSGIAPILDLLRGDAAADQVVPPNGGLARLTSFAAGAMAFLAVIAVALTLGAQRVATHWSDALNGVATVELPRGNDSDITRLIAILGTTPGVGEVIEISPARQRALLEPWLGEAFPTDALQLPRLVELHTDADFDPVTLSLRLEGELPEAVFVPNSQLHAQVAAAALGLGWIGWGALLLTGLVMAAIITLSASVALAANLEVIATLRLLGAQDDFIARAFIRRSTMRGAGGALIGVLLGVGILLLASTAGEGTQMKLAPGPMGWILISLIPVLAAAIAFAATRFAAMRTLARLT